MQNKKQCMLKEKEHFQEAVLLILTRISHGPKVSENARDMLWRGRKKILVLTY
jgi:hypothetical protein